MSNNGVGYSNTYNDFNLPCSDSENHNNSSNSPTDNIDVASLNNVIASLSKNVEFICNLVRSADLSIYDDSSKQYTLSNTNNELISN